MKMKPVSILNILLALLILGASVGYAQTPQPQLAPPAGLMETAPVNVAQADVTSPAPAPTPAIDVAPVNAVPPSTVPSTVPPPLPPTAAPPVPVPVPLPQLPTGPATAPPIPPAILNAPQGTIVPAKVTPNEGPNGKITYVDRPEDSQLILEFLLEDKVTTLDPGLPVYLAEEETILIPLGKFAKELGFPIKVDTAQGTATGWFGKQENTFQLSSPYSSVEIGGKKIPISKHGIVETHLDDIYVSQDLLTQWFPIGLTFNYHELRLYLKPLASLPFQEEAQRHKEWAAAQASQQPGLQYDPATIIHLPYNMYSPPALQISNGYTLTTSQTSHISSELTTVNGTQDLLGMSAHYSLGLSKTGSGSDQLQGINFNLEKEDYSGDLLGPLKATQYQLGDVTTGTFPLASQETGRGALVTNQPYNFVSDAANFQIQGYGPVGWEVEVYQSDELLAFGPLDATGHYTFPALPLKTGFNLFKIILYGPNGEQQVRFERYYLGQDMVPAGKFYYNATALQMSTPLLNVLQTQRAPDTAPTMSTTGEYGITKNLSAMMGVFSGPIGNNDLLQGTGYGLRYSGSSAYLQTNAFLDQSGGRSYTELLTGNISETSTFNLQDLRHEDFAPDIYTTLRTSTASITKQFTFLNKIIPSINTMLQEGRTVEEGGQVEKSTLFHLSSNFLGLNLSNDLEKDTFAVIPAPPVDNGHLALSAHTPIGMLHSDLLYTLSNPSALSSGTLSLESVITPTVSLTNGLSHTFGLTPATAFTPKLDWALKKFRLEFTGSIDDHHNRAIGVTLNYNLTPQTMTGGYVMSGGTEADLDAGSLIIRPFVDRYGTGVYQKGDVLLKGIIFRNMLRGTLSVTAQDGSTILHGLVPNLANRITLDTGSVPDIYLKPAKKELVVLGKIGVNGPVDFPFTKLGDLNGKIVTTDAAGKQIPLDQVHIVLLGSDGKEVSDVYSESDGFFSFDTIPLGSYTLFFPVSETLQKVYAGNGKGPGFTINYDSPEIADALLTVTHDNVLLGKESDQSTPPTNPPVPPAQQPPVSPSPIPLQAAPPVNGNKK